MPADLALGHRRVRRQKWPDSLAVGFLACINIYSMSVLTAYQLNIVIVPVVKIKMLAVLID